MIVKRHWCRYKKTKMMPDKYEKLYVAYYHGWFLLGFIPLYIRRGNWRLA